MTCGQRKQLAKEPSKCSFTNHFIPCLVKPPLRVKTSSRYIAIENEIAAIIVYTITALKPSVHIVFILHDYYKRIVKCNSENKHEILRRYYNK